MNTEEQVARLEERIEKLEKRLCLQIEVRPYEPAEMKDRTDDPVAAAMDRVMGFMDEARVLCLARDALKPIAAIPIDENNVTMHIVSVKDIKLVREALQEIEEALA